MVQVQDRDRCVRNPEKHQLCAHAILCPSTIFEVPDATLDPRFSENPLVRGEPHLRYYAGVPLVSDDGGALGTLCVADRIPRRLTPEQAAILRVLGRQAVGLLNDRRRRRVLRQVVQHRSAGLRAANKRLEEESRRSLELAQRAEASARAKDEFLLMMSHELRTPMNAVLGMTGFLLESGLSPEQRDLAQSVLFSGSSLLTDLEDILEFTQLGANPTPGKTSEFSLSQLLEDAVLKVSHSADEKDLSLTCKIHPGLPDHLRGYPAHTLQVVLNLLSNAVKFTAAGKISVEVHPGPRWPEFPELVFEVHDTGPGIREQDQRLLFQPFFQVDSTTTRRFGGTGLGLAICRRLVQMMGGTIGVRSEPGCGTTFWFRLPCALPCGPSLPTPSRSPEPTSPVPAASPPEKPGQPLPVLVAAHHPTSRRIASQLLQKRGFVVETVASGQEVLMRWGERRYTSLFIEGHLPEVDGFEVSRRIRRFELVGGREHIPIIALMAETDEDARSQCLNAGMDSVLTVPIEIHALEGLLQRMPTPPGNGPLDPDSGLPGSGPRLS